MRIRTIKPEFWASESVGRMDRDTRLTFIGLWSLADDHGRFRADPRFVAGQLFPYDSDGPAISSRALASLSAEGSVVLYEVSGSHYGAITGWERHQKIDKRSSSRLPAPEEGKPTETRVPPIPREDSAEAREKLVLDLVPRNREQGAGNREEDLGPEATDVAGHHPLAVVWNANCAPTQPRWTTTGSKRRKHADGRLRERSLEEWATVVKRLAASDFASGRTGKWVATPDWLMGSPDNATKVLEGNYDNRTPSRSGDVGDFSNVPASGAEVSF